MILKEIFVLVEHRQGQIRDITFEMLAKGKELADKTEADLVSVLMGKRVKEHAKTLSEHSEKVMLVEDVELENFNSESYKEVLSTLIRDHKPLITMIGHSSFGVDLAPRLAAALKLPLATDCIDLEFNGETLSVTRQMYGGKVNVKATVSKSESYLITIRQAAFQAQKSAFNGEIIEKTIKFSSDTKKKCFVEYVLPPPSGVDITAAEAVVGIGRGLKDESNMSIVEEFAKSIGGVLACSRPIVDKGWLPNDRQVGSSGKTVKPKLYVALGISGAFQHVLGMKNSDLIIAINKDSNAPIFNFSDYGVVDDLLNIVPRLSSKISELKGQKT